MAKKNKRTGRHADRGAAGDRGWEFSPWEPALALVPCRIGTKPVVDGTGFGGGGLAVKVELGPPDPIDIGVDAEKLKSVYEALLRIPGITPEIYRAVRKALGRSLQAEKAEYEKGRTLVWLQMVEEIEARMRANGPMPYGGWHTRAVQEVAEKIGMEPKTLQQRFDRLED